MLKWISGGVLCYCILMYISLACMYLSYIFLATGDGRDIGPLLTSPVKGFDIGDSDSSWKASRRYR